MSKVFSSRATRQTSNRSQAYVLLGVGALSLLGALLVRSNPYPIGVFLFGFGLLLSTAFNPYRLMAAAILMFVMGIAVFFAFTRYIPAGGSDLIVAIGIAWLGIAFAARRGYIGNGAITPGIITLIIGLVEYPPAARLLPGNYVAFLLSLWFPAIGLLVLGVVYLLLSSRK